MWLFFAFFSAAMLGCYDFCKKHALRSNAVIPVLFLNTLLSSLFLVPFVIMSATTDTLDGSTFRVASADWKIHGAILLQAIVVTASHLLNYYSMKHLPLTIVSPIKVTRPMMVLLGAFLAFGEHLNFWHWMGFLLTIFSFVILSRSGKKEGIDFWHSRWIWMLFGGAMLGAFCSLNNKYLVASGADGGADLDPMFVQSWYYIYQCLVMLVVLLVLWWPKRHMITRFHWTWSIIGVSLFLAISDNAYFYSLSMPGAMISVVSLVSRSSVVVSFLFGAIFFHEKNLRAKAVDLLLLLLGMVFLYIGSL